VRVLRSNAASRRSRENRYAGIADARVDIETALNDPRGVTPVTLSQGQPRRWPLTARLVTAAGLIAAGAVLAVLVAFFQPAPMPAPPLVNRFAYVIPEDQPIRGSQVAVLAVSPDGRRFVYNAAGGFRLREMSELGARLISGTQDLGGQPLFSPDGQSIVYFAPAPASSFRRIGIDGGASVLVSRVSGLVPQGASWNADGTIVFAMEPGIFRVPAAGGTPQLIIEPSPGKRLFGPRLLPDGDTLLFSVSDGAMWDSAEIVVQSLATGNRRTLLAGGSDARYVPTGHLVYASGDALFGVAFDLSTLSVSGGALSLVQGLVRADVTPAANFGIGADGTLVYLSGASAQPMRTVVWVDRDGREEPTGVPPREYVYVQLSPDGTRLSLDARDGESDIWIFDLEREILQRLTVDPGRNRGGLWTPDGSRVLFSRALAGSEEIYWQAADGSAAPLPLTADSGEAVLPEDVTPDGNALLYIPADRPADIFIATLGETGAGPAPLIATPAEEFGAQVSPDGRWLVYQSNESGRFEIYVRPFPAVDTGRWQISTDGGTRPRWSRDGRELFYLNTSSDGRAALMAVAIESEAGFRAALPELVFEGAYAAPRTSRLVYDVSLDGRRFLMLKDTADEPSASRPQIVVVQNWTEELKRLVPRD
jgi:eukaryotic-like serine/threonine-protein kinase